jgi:hypothetical protein
VYTDVRNRRPLFLVLAVKVSINKLIDKASAAGMNVIYIRNLYDNNWHDPKAYS